MSHIFSRKLVPFASAVLVLMAACGGGDSPTGPTGDGGGTGNGGGSGVGALAIVRVQPRTQRVDMGSTMRLQASATDASGRSVSGVSISWESLNRGIAVVSNDGIVTAQAAGQARIVARAQGFTDTAVVTVEAVPEGSLTLEAHRMSLTPGKTGTLVAVVRDGSGAVVKGDITWVAEYPGVANVDGKGIVTAKSPGTTRVIATSGAHADTARITVAKPSATGVPARLEVDPSPLVVQRGRSAELRAVAYDADGDLVGSIAVSWRSLNSGIASVSDGGTVTGLVEGTTSVIASLSGASRPSGGLEDTIRVTVSAPPVSGVVVTPKMLTLTAGGTGSLSATARDDRGNPLAGRKITWRSDNPGIVAVASNGMVTGVSAGSARVIAASEGKADTAMVMVTAAAPAPGPTPGPTPTPDPTPTPTPVPTSVSVAPTPVTLVAGASQGLTATVRDQSGNTMGVAVTWSTSNAGVATVSSSGVVTAVSAGTATIRAQAGSVNGTVTVTVTAPTQHDMSRTPTDIGSIGGQDGWAAQLPGVLVAGDNDDHDVAPLQAFITYSLADLPANATIESAKLGLSMEPLGAMGEPFELGGLYVEWAPTLSLETGAPGAGSVLVTSSFAASTSTDVVDLVRAARAAGATSVTFRVRFAQPRDNDGETDQLELAAGNLDLTVSY